MGLAHGCPRRKDASLGLLIHATTLVESDENARAAASRTSRSGAFSTAISGSTARESPISPSASTTALCICEFDPGESFNSVNLTDLNRNHIRLETGL